MFSVILSNYNYEKFIGDAINSVLQQTFDEFELIVVDDGSTDGSRDIIDSFNDKRIEKIYKSNGGQASAFNAGFEKATGRYVAFLDSDDLFDSDKLERVYAKFVEKDYALVQHQLRVIDQNGNLKEDRFPGTLEIGEGDILKRYHGYLRTDYFSSSSGLASPRRILRNIFPIDETKWRICADGPISRPLPIFGLTYTLETPAGTYRIHGKNNWMETERRENSLGQVQYDLVEYTNRFLYRWNKNIRMESSIAPELLDRYGIKDVYVYGASQYSLLLLLSGSIPAHINIIGVIDDSFEKDTFLKFPIIRHKSLKKMNKQTAVIVPNKHNYPEFIEKSIGLKFEYIFACHGKQDFLKKSKLYIEKLLEVLQRRNHRRIALFGLNFQTVNLILSDVFYKNSGIQIEAIYDENPKIYSLLGIPVLKSNNSVYTEFDAVVVLDEQNEPGLFMKAIRKFKKNVYLFHGPVKTLRGNRSDHEDIRRKFVNRKSNKIAILGASYFTQCLLQSGNLDEFIKVSCIIDSHQTLDSELFGVKVYSPEDKNIPEFDVLLIPPGYKKKYHEECQRFNGKPTLALPENVNDIAVVFDYLRNNKRNPIMFDVGANMGTSFKPFLSDGWEVYAFEPAERMNNYLRAAYGKIDNVHLIKQALSNKEVKQLPLFISDVSDGITALSDFHYSHCFSEYVEVTTLESFLSNFDIPEIDFLKIDVEGYDFFVLQGNDWNKFKPRVIMCEYEERKTLPLGYSTAELIQFLDDLGYRMIISELFPVCEYGNQQRWRGFVEYPQRLFDDDSCGNIIAFREKSDYRKFVDGVWEKNYNFKSMA